MDLTKKLAEAKMRLDEAKAAITEDDREEIAQRAELAQIEEERRDAERLRRDLDLERRLSKARDTLGDVKMKAVTVKEFPDTFIVVRKGKAHAAWTESMSNAAHSKLQGQKIDRGAINRKYATEVVYDWNGTTDFDANPESTRQLVKFLIENPGVVTPLTDAAAELSGVFAEERKS